MHLNLIEVHNLVKYDFDWFNHNIIGLSYISEASCRFDKELNKDVAIKVIDLEEA
jgi:hypothetical protein